MISMISFKLKKYQRSNGIKSKSIILEDDFKEIEQPSKLFYF